jgi:acyl-CoA reductase-like NAD-dependent aldehyde dehydrogenase
MTDINFDQWRVRARQARVDWPAFIDGRTVAAISGEQFPMTDPATGKVWAHVAACDAVDVDLAVKSARAAFEARRWAGLKPRERKRILLRLAELMREHREELALLETLSVGKPIAQALSIDLRAAPDAIAYYAEACDKVYDQIAPTGANDLALIVKEPIGVVGLVVPWNFPLMMACWKLGPALAAGNSVVLKPAEQSPLSALRLGELAIEAGLPVGVLNVVPGFGETAGRALGLHPDVDVIAFTGSTEVGKLFLTYSGQSNMKKVWLECGGKTPNIIMADCPDIDAAVAASVEGVFFNQGEMCTSASRLLVDRRIKDRVMAGLLKHTKSWVPGNPLDPATISGALVSQTHMETVLGYIDSARDEGAHIAAGGEQVLKETGGAFVAPTLLDKVTPGMRVAREEIFGPVLSIIEFDGEDEAIAIANGTVYGLGAAVWTSNLSTAHRMSRRIKAGIVYVNCFDADDITTPFGGYKQSGIGRDKSLHAIDKYTETKTVWIRI